MTRPKGATAVMASRRSPPRALDSFPTPPWPMCAGIELIRELDTIADGSFITETARGEGRMAHVPRDAFAPLAPARPFDEPAA